MNIAMRLARGNRVARCREAPEQERRIAVEAADNPDWLIAAERGKRFLCLVVQFVQIDRPAATGGCRYRERRLIPHRVYIFSGADAAASNARTISPRTATSIAP